MLHRDSLKRFSKPVYTVSDGRRPVKCQINQGPGGRTPTFEAHRKSGFDGSPRFTESTAAPLRRGQTPSAPILPSDSPRSTAVDRDGEGVAYPTAPASTMLSSINRFISTAYSIGNSRTIGSMNPATTIEVACSSVSPRLIR